MRTALACLLVLVLTACSGTAPSPQSAGGGRSTSDPRVASFRGQSLPPGSGGTWLRTMATPAPKVIYYQFAFPG